ncbi:MAG: hypothetical protein ACJ74H_17070, partial [Thermoanaerobaculia bacterium]
MRGRFAALLLSVVVVVGGAFITVPYVHGLSFVIRTADMQGTARRLADLDRGEERERDITIPTANGALRARAYDP